MFILFKFGRVLGKAYSLYLYIYESLICQAFGLSLSCNNSMLFSTFLINLPLPHNESLCCCRDILAYSNSSSLKTYSLESNFSFNSLF